MKILPLFCITMICVGLSETALAKKLPTKKIGLSEPTTVMYQCDDGQRVRASYYSLDDDSLHFVKLAIKGVSYTLPAIVSASGVRYTTELDIEWWTKGDAATLDEMVNDDKSPLVQCKEFTLPNKRKPS